MNLSGFPFLPFLIGFPLILAAILGFLRDPVAARRLALGGAGFELALSLGMLARFDFESPRFQFLQRAPWMQDLNVDFLVAVDGISVLFLPLTALLTLAVIVATWTSVRERVPLYLALLFLLEGATIGVFAALDLVLFFLFWELTLVPVFFLVSLWGIGPDRRHAAVKYTLFMLAGGVPLLLGIVLLAFSHAGQLSLAVPGGLSFDYLVLLHVDVAEELRNAIFLLLLLGFGVKVPLFPFHGWLPTLALEGPAGVAAIVTGLKLGLYGLIRFALPLLPDAARDLGWVLGLLGIAGLLYGALIALRQTNLRGLLAWSSISHAGLVAAGLSALNLQAAQGALLQVLNFAAISGGLFLLAGFLQRRTDSTDLSHLGGAAAPMPRLAAVSFVLGLAAIGVPGTGGFTGEHLLLIGLFEANRGAGLAALAGIVLAAAYFLGFFQRAFFGPVRRPAVAEGADLLPRELMLALLFAGLALLPGLAPNLVLDASRKSMEAWVAKVTDADLAFNVAALPGDSREADGGPPP
jgi:NADH-quinone oxidoreductase subunit M